MAKLFVRARRADGTSVVLRRVLRVDLAQTPQGGLEAPSKPLVTTRKLGDGSVVVTALIARTGVLEYTDEQGKVTREYRPPEEVFDPRSLASFDGVTVTNLHPEGEVTADNWKDLAIGNVHTSAVEHDGYVRCELAIKDAASLAAIKAEELIEVSAGYTCGVLQMPGVTSDGEEYDAIQVGIEANHIALGPLDWGRSGGHVRLYYDSKDAAYGRLVSTRTPPKKKDGLMDPDELLAKYNELLAAFEALKAEHEALKASAPEEATDSEEEDTTDSEEATDSEEEEEKEKEGKADGKKPKAKPRVTADSMLAKIERKAEIVAKVRLILRKDSISAVGNTERALMLMGIKYVNTKFDAANKSDDYLRAIFDQTFEDVVKARAKSNARVQQQDSAAEDPYEAYAKRQKDRWKTKA